ncbi:gonadal protein gdl-ORF39 [Drosophila eugracilis]|nr:gonadal protein gdl-ORF39 [Drosophila eugracilis]
MWLINLVAVTLLILHLATLAVSCSCGEEANLECGCTKRH